MAIDDITSAMKSNSSGQFVLYSISKASLYVEPAASAETTAEAPKVSKELIGGLINELEELTVMLRD